jgi:hypothetical protein
MGRRDPRVDDYIATAASFAQPILRRVHKLAHEASLRVQETTASADYIR